MGKIIAGIPVFNEGRNLENLYYQLSAVYKGDIVFVDDGSTDNSAAIISNFNNCYVIKNKRNEGYGQSLINIFNYAINSSYEILITLDADGQHEVAQLMKFIEIMRNDKQLDILSGSRYLCEFAGNAIAPAERYNLNREIIKIINDITDFGITDAFCGMKAYKVAALRKLVLTEKGYAFPIEVWLEIYKKNLTVKEVAIKRIYPDENRFFGNGLDNTKKRRAYYLNVLHKSREALYVR
ncbi:MAG: glycosyltransferase family 2 protein [bacterium]|nr:glycosyltransferase family 2 protein [bacterium]